jgi:uncharacterized protein YjbI with pentapeptide repeats
MSPYRAGTCATTGRMQREARKGRQARRAIVDWQTCDAEGQDCSGVQVGSYGRCWAHLSPEELRRVLRSLAPGEDLDLRGTSLDGQLLGQILSAFRQPHSRNLLIGNASLENARIEGEASFGDAVFDGDARFFGAKFRDKADFYGAEFRSYAGFNGADFNYADFERAKFTGGPVSFKYVRFLGPAEFADVRFERRTEFIGAKFLHDAYFQRVRSVAEVRFEQVKFRGVASFQHGRFDGFAGFGGARFTLHADFVDVRFGGDSSFGGAKIGSAAWFTGCIFSGKADFSEMTFNGGAWFDGSKFESDASFAAAKVEADALFNNVDVTGDVAFDQVEVKGETFFRRMTVGGELRLDDFKAIGTVEATVAANRVKCTRAKFDDRVWLSLAGGDLWLTDSEFAAPITIESSLRQAAGARPEADADLVRVRVRSLRGTDAEHLTLTDADLSRCVLSGLRRPEQLRLGGQCVFAPTPRGLYWRWKTVPWRWTAREALFEEHLWRSGQAAPGPRDQWGHLDPGAEDSAEATPERLEVLYRQLRSSLEAARNEPGASDFYYGEMEMRRRAARNRSERWLLNGYWLVSGYGLRAIRALAGLVVLVLAAALVLQYAGFQGPMPSYPYCVLYAAASIVSLSVASHHLPAVMTASGDVMRIVLRVGGPVLLGLAALAIRGRVKR